MMYFFVSKPPNTFVMARPAFSAMSVKFAKRAEAGVAGAVAVCAMVKQVLANSPRNIQSKNFRWMFLRSCKKFIFNTGLLVRDWVSGFGSWNEEAFPKFIIFQMHILWTGQGEAQRADFLQRQDWRVGKVRPRGCRPFVFAGGGKRLSPTFLSLAWLPRPSILPRPEEGLASRLPAATRQAPRRREAREF